MLRLIGIDGDKGSGKDTIAEVLIRNYGFKRLAFAQPLKDILSEVFLLSPDSFEDRVLKEELFPVPLELTSYHIQRILDCIELRGIKVTDQAIRACLLMAGTKLHSRREMMQIVGTEMVRTNVGYETWVTIWSKEQEKYDRVIAPDARFANEREAITVRKGKNLLVKRPGLKSNDGHASENNHGADADYDAVVNNVVGKQQIQSEFAMWFTTIKDKDLR